MQTFYIAGMAAEHPPSSQITTVAMQYIDSAMVGKLGANKSASIGNVSTSMADERHQHGGGRGVFCAGNDISAQGRLCPACDEARLCRRAVDIADIDAAWHCHFQPLPRWLGGKKRFGGMPALTLLFAITMPFMTMNRMAASFLQSAGNMVVPSVLNAMMCVLDVVFNAIFIPKYGLLGAGIGTCLATVVVCFAELWFCCFRYEPLRLNRREKCPLDMSVLRRALRIGAPVGAESMAMSGAHVASTVIIAPLGAISMAAHTLAITAESLCYMPGYGIATAASTLGRASAQKTTGWRGATAISPCPLAVR